MDTLIKISSTDEQLPADATDYVALHDPLTNLTWARDESPEEMNHAAAVKYAAEASLAGSNEWRMPTRKELFGITDDTLFNPAINPLFNSHGDWVWTSTPDPSYSDCAFVVDFDLGTVGIPSRGNGARVRLVRSVARASQ
jgi:hypothetical protein